MSHPSHKTRRDLPAGLLLTAAAACLVAWILSGCSGKSPKPRAVILISVDTLRSDHLPAYGYRAVATPHLDRLRARSVLFQRAFSNCPLTLPAHASMLTGLLPSEHGIRDNLGYRLPSGTDTTAALLRRAGYRTGAMVSAHVLRRETGLAHGFDRYDDDVRSIDGSDIVGRLQRDGGDTLTAATRWIESTGDDPFFLFLHLYEPHSPYEPSYDGEIEKVDALLGRLFEFLEQRDVFDDALIVVTSDHGEGLNEHGEEEHGILLYREALQVPLIVKLPRDRSGGATVEVPVQIADLFATIADGAGVEPPARSNSRSLLPLLRGERSPSRPIHAETFYPRLHLGWSELHSLIEDGHHYVHGRHGELFDLERDPAERADLLRSQRRRAARMREAIAPFIRDAAAPAPIDPEDAVKLSALGYLGSGAGDGGELLPDPRSRMNDLRKLRQAFAAAGKGRHDEALRLSAEVLAENPRVVDLWDLRAKELVALGRFEEAIEDAKSGLRIAPATVGLIASIATAALELGQFEEAERHAELLRTAEPAAALVFLGGIAKKRGDLQSALLHLNEARALVAQRPSVRVPNLHLFRGDVLARMGRAGEAEAELRLEIAAYPERAEGYAALTMVLVEQNKLVEATRTVRMLATRVPTAHGYYTAAETLQALGDTKGSRYWAAEGLRRFPEDAVLREMAGERMADVARR